MNRIITDSLAEAIQAAGSPAADPSAARVLFLHGMVLGNATYARELERAAAAHDGLEAYHVELTPAPWMSLAGARLPGPSQWDGQRLRHMAMWRARLGGRLARAVRQGLFDSVHILTRDVSAALPPGVPCIVNIDATATLEAREFGHAGGGLLAAWERAIFRRASAVACWSEWAAESVRVDFGVSADRVTLAPPGIDLSRIPPRRARPKEKARIAFVGNDWHRKRGADVVRWHQSRWSERAELHVFSDRAPSLRGLPSVVRHGRVDREELLHKHLPTMDLLVLPTAEETFGWVLLEAAAAGVPVVASRLAAIPEQVADGHTGLLISPGDDQGFVNAIQRLLDSPEHARRMGEAARRRAATTYDSAMTYRALFDRLARLGVQNEVRVSDCAVAGTAA